MINQETAEMPTNKNFIDLTGHVYSRLTVLGYARKKGKHHYWHCSCDCSKKSVVASTSLRSGHTQSCGCYHNERRSEIFSTHGLSSSPEYKAFHNMKSRCLNENAQSYVDYGGRGITICDRWIDSFANFHKDMGDKPSPSHSIDRENNEGNYEPSNCRWATQLQQVRNQRMKKNNTSGTTGVFFNKTTKKWYPSVHINGARKHLGVFTDEDEAKAVRWKAEQEHYT